MAPRLPPQAPGGAETHRALAVAEAAAAGSAVLALLSCCAAAACSLAGQGQVHLWLVSAKPQRVPSLSPLASAPLAKPGRPELCSAALL